MVCRSPLQATPPEVTSHSQTAMHADPSAWLNATFAPLPNSTGTQ